MMQVRYLVVTGIVAGVLAPCVAAAQLPGLNAGTVNAVVNGAPFSGNVSIATIDDEGTLILTSLSNVVQIQVPDAKVGTSQITVDADGDLVGVIISLKVRNRILTPVSGTLTIEALGGGSAAGRFEFAGTYPDTNEAVKVTGGRFQVKLRTGR